MTPRVLFSTTATIALLSAGWPGNLFAQTFEPIDFAALSAECQAVIIADGTLDPVALTTEIIEVNEDGTCVILVEGGATGEAEAGADAEAEVAEEAVAPEAVVEPEPVTEEPVVDEVVEPEPMPAEELTEEIAPDEAVTSEPAMESEFSFRNLSEECQAAILADGTIDPAQISPEQIIIAADGSCEVVIAGSMSEPDMQATEGEGTAAETEELVEPEVAVEPEAGAEAETEVVVEPEPAAEEPVVDEAAEPEAVPVEESTEEAAPEDTAEPAMETEFSFRSLSEECQAVILADGTIDPARLRPEQLVIAADGSCEVVADGLAAEPEVRAAEEPAPAAAAEAVDGTEESPDAVDVVTETVTEETARSSDEEVDEAAAERQSATTEASADSSGFSNNEILRILGAAALGVAIGSTLDNDDEVVENTGDRIIVLRDGRYIVRADENELLRRPGTSVRTEAFADGSTRTIVTNEDGSRIVTIRDAYGYTIRRTRFLADGTEYVLFDDTEYANNDIELTPLPELSTRAEYRDYSTIDEEELLLALQQAEARELDGTYSLRQIRESEELRSHLPRIDLDVITFATGSAAISNDQARSLAALGRVMARLIEDNPAEVFLIEGHTDAVGSEISNLALSDRRAETVALALSEFYGVPPENMIVQGYGEEFLKVQTLGAERANRRTAVRRITNLLGT